MEEIKVGEYVRTKKGYIAKLESVNDNFMFFDDMIYCYYEEAPILNLKNINEMEQIKAHSKALIDLIEKDDYVNGERVLVVDDIITDGGEKAILVENYDEWTDDGVITNKDIKYIVTHEQFAQIEYKVEE